MLKQNTHCKTRDKTNGGGMMLQLLNCKCDPQNPVERVPQEGDQSTCTLGEMVLGIHPKLWECGTCGERVNGPKGEPLLQPRMEASNAN